eukprot:m.12226 g.12226  ORF g.12226 m.12226 type:complete len:254 (-) comp6175_c0_seq1:1746-2507(-)
MHPLCEQRQRRGRGHRSPGPQPEQRRWPQALHAARPGRAQTGRPQRSSLRPSTTKVVLAGHSIGSHICLEMLRRLPEGLVLQTFLLFPTIHHIGSTPNGYMYFPLVAYFRSAAGHFVHLLERIPSWCQRKLVAMHMPGVHPSITDSVLALMHERVALNALFMANREFEEVLTLDEDHIRAHASSLVFFFSPSDQWLTDDHVADIVDVAIGSQVHRCKEDVPHAFVLKSSVPVAMKTWEYLAPVITAYRDSLVI